MEGSIIAGGLLVCVSLVILIPILVLVSEVGFSLVPDRTAKPPLQGRPPVVVLIPAHDEASSIAATLKNIRAELLPGDRALVVADNCSDETREVAERAGAETIVRQDSVRRGKGYALDFGIRHLAPDPPAIVIVVDADCQLEAGALDALARTCAHTGRPVQGLYRMLALQGAGPLRRLAQFAWSVRNQVRPLGLRRMGLPCQLMGSGMAFPWEAVSASQLASGHLVEDLKLGIDLAAAGLPPVFCPDAVINSYFPASGAGVTSQRTRWEHGHLSLLLGLGPRLLSASLTRGRLAPLVLALDLLVPPLALLSLLTAVFWVITLAFALGRGTAAALVVSSMDLALLSGAILAAWLRFGRKVVSAADLALAIVYVVVKIPLYFRFLFARQVDWVRSHRGSDGGSPGA